MSVAHMTIREHGDITGQGSCPRQDVDVQGLEEVAPPLTGCCPLESWPHPSPAQCSGKACPMPHLGNTVELTLIVKAHVSQS